MNKYFGVIVSFSVSFLLVALFVYTDYQKTVLENEYSSLQEELKNEKKAKKEIQENYGAYIDETRDFLAIDHAIEKSVGNKKWIANEYTCKEFSLDAVAQLSANGILAKYTTGWAPIESATQKEIIPQENYKRSCKKINGKDYCYHAFVAVYIEPQTGKIIKLQDGYILD